MALKKRKKLKVKNFIIFIIIVLIMIFSLYKVSVFIVKKIFTKEEKVVEKNETLKKEIEKTDPLKEKYSKLDNINQKLDFFIDENIDRYISYKEKNSDLSLEQVIINVNIGLDNEYYTDVKPAINLDQYNVLVNKYHSLSKDYVPKDLEDIDTKYAIKGMKMVSYAKDAFEEMSKAALKDKMHILAMSTYRSYDYQVNLYNKYAKKDGVDAANTYSAKAGFSEHQTGLAVDVYNGSTSYTSFEKTKEFNWMQENAYKYGFIMRYPKDKEKETGYKYEAWHYRYIGKEIAKYIHDNKFTYEEYYVRFLQNKK
ncbi:MAG: M15 family metallopeptidase [Bacilli bacterium]|nr:M15 family metallopeptidase [Bacilli bacterium]